MKKIFILFLMIITYSGFAQNQKISGKVTDSTGGSLPGVSVVVKGTTIGTITNSDGNFTIQLPANAKVLVFSFVGMKWQEVAVDGKTTINVTLAEDAIDIEEVVAVGYATMTRKELIGSIASVSATQIKDVPVNSVAEAIVGKLPGVRISSSEGGPDAEIVIRVRGGGSITQDNSPLYIVDGFPVDQIKDIPPTDISSIDVLKDASSTAIYGARGANGVVIITTKKGTIGNAKVSFNGFMGMKKVAKFYDVLSPYEYVLWQRETIGPNSFQTYYGNPSDMDLYKEMRGTNWQKELLGNTGIARNGNLSVTGGNNSVKYNVSLTRTDNDEIMTGSKYSMTGLNISTTYKANKWLSFDVNARMSDIKINGGGTSQGDASTTGSSLYHMVRFRPVTGFSEYVDLDLINESDVTVASILIDPVSLVNDTYRRSNNLSFSFNGAAIMQLNKSITYRFEYGTQYLKSYTDRFYGLNTGQSRAFGIQPLASKSLNDGFSSRIANILTFSKKDFLPNQNITIMLGEELNHRTSYATIVSAKYFPKYIDAIGALNLMQLGTQDVTTTMEATPQNTSSFFGRLNYDFKQKYSLSASLRADGSSKFAPENRWGYFPAMGFGWRVSDEGFMKNTNTWLSNLKLRASYGQSGNDRIPADAWKSTFSASKGNLYLTDETTQTPYIANADGIMANPDLRWETTISQNIGLDFDLFKNMLSGTIEVYNNHTKDLLLRSSIPQNSGYRFQYQNIAETSNKGIELSFNAKVIDKKDFRLSTSFNIAFNNSRIEKLGDAKSFAESSTWSFGNRPTQDYLIEEGGKVGNMYGYQIDGAGFYTLDDFTYNPAGTSIATSYTLKPGVQRYGANISTIFGPGALKLVDQNKDGIIDSNDKVILGNGLPVSSGGFDIVTRYKGFDCTANFNWSYGNDIYNANNLVNTANPNNYSHVSLSNLSNSENRFKYVDPNDFTTTWIKDPVKLYEANKNVTIWNPQSISTVQLTSWAIEDGSFLRFNNLTVGYTFPKHLLRKVGIDQLRIYTTAYNLWVWTNYSGNDPEVSTGSSSITPGIDWGSYPRSRSLSFGLNLTL